MRMTTSHASTNNNISTSNFNSNPASDHLQHKRHQQHIPTSGTVTNFGYSDWGISPSASWTRISRNKTKYSLMSSISWLVEGQQVDRKKDFLQLNAWQQQRRSHAAHNYRRGIASRLIEYRRQHRAITDISEVAQRAKEEGNFPIITIVYLQTQARSKRPSIQ